MKYMKKVNNRKTWVDDINNAHFFGRHCDASNSINSIINRNFWYTRNDKPISYSKFTCHNYTVEQMPYAVIAVDVEFSYNVGDIY